MKKVVCFIVLIMCVLPAKAQWIHSPIWKLGGNPLASGIIGALAIPYNTSDFRVLFPVTDGEIPNATTKRMWNKCSWWYPFFNYEIPIAFGPNIEVDGKKADTKSLSTLVAAIGYQFGYFPKGTFPVGGRVKFLFQEEAFAIKFPNDENFFCYEKSSMIPSGDIFVRIGSYATKHFCGIIICGMEYKKTLGCMEKQWEKSKIFTFQNSKSKYEYEKVDKGTINNGVMGNFGGGIINTRTGRMITITYQKDFFNYFNSDYVDSDGNKPYKGVKNNSGYISVNICFVP